VIRIIEETGLGFEGKYEIEIEAVGMDKDYIHHGLLPIFWTCKMLGFRGEQL